MGMGNLIKYIRYEISHVAQDLSEANAKVRTYVRTCILLMMRYSEGYHDSSTNREDLPLNTGASDIEVNDFFGRAYCVRTREHSEQLRGNDKRR